MSDIVEVIARANYEEDTGLTWPPVTPEVAEAYRSDARVAKAALDAAGFAIVPKEPTLDVVGALGAAIRAANLALFVIRKQGIMPNESWADGFKKDMEKAEGVFAQLKGEGA